MLVPIHLNHIFHANVLLLIMHLALFIISTPHLVFALHAQAPLSSPSSAEIDISRFLIGTWKRNLEWRQFGGTFQHVRTSNTIVLIEEFSRMDAEPNTRFLRWSFGKSFQKSELRFGYEMKFYSPPKSKEVELSWQYSGTVCHGKFLPSSNVAILNFFLRSSAVVVVYRIVDADSASCDLTQPFAVPLAFSFSLTFSVCSRCVFHFLSHCRFNH